MEYLIKCDPVKYPPGDYAKIVSDVNDTLQGRGDRTVEELLAEVDAVCGHLGIYNAEWLMFRQAVDDFQHQKALLSQKYTKISDKQYQYEMHNGKKVIDQQLYDQAAKDGFPVGFFQHSYFRGVTLYCLPDGQYCQGSEFHQCTFAVCRICNYVTFECSSFYDCEFHTCALNFVNFWNATLAYTHFYDCKMEDVSFREARLKSCNVMDCVLERINFLLATLDGCTFDKVNAHAIQYLDTATITQGGATSEEVQRNRKAILAALRPQQRARREAPAKKRGGR